MPKFTVNVERRMVQWETASITVEAKNAAEAKKLGKAQAIENPDAAEWESSTSDYDNYRVDDVVPTGGAAIDADDL
jgi:hypothetical protein